MSTRESTAPITTTLPRHPQRSRRWSVWSRAALSGSAMAWLTVTLGGQLFFAAYVAKVYGGAAAAGQYERWNKVLPRGFDASDPVGSAMLGLHLLLAITWALSGVLQLIPAVRRRMPKLHRWNGRAYLGFAVVLAIGGLWLVWVRGGVVGDVSQHAAISINALLILGCAAMTWRTARARQFVIHRRWALRLFVVASGVWFFRVGLMAWLAFYRRPVGFDPATFQGPFLTFLAISVYVLVPLLLLQLYLFAQDHDSVPVQLVATLVMGVATLTTAGGTLAAVGGMWLPRMVL